MKLDNPDIGEKALSKVAEVGISSQLDKIDSLEVDLRSDPRHLVQGKVDSVAISGRGLVMKQDIRLESLEVNVGEVAINPLSAVLGNIELTHPSDAEARIVLTEVDINRALESDYILEKLQGIEIDVDEHSETINIQKLNLTLPGENKFAITAQFSISHRTDSKALNVVAVPSIQAGGNRVSLELLSAQGQGLTAKLVTIILNQVTDLLDLRNFKISGMSIQMKQLEAQAGKLIIQGITQVQNFPSG